MHGHWELISSTRFGVGAGFPRPIPWILELGGENPPLHCGGRYFFKCHNLTLNFSARVDGKLRAESLKGGLMLRKIH